MGRDFCQARVSTANALLNSAHATVVFNRRIRTLATHIAAHLDHGSVLDVGCGDGALAKAIAGLNPKLAFEGIDVFLRPVVAIPARLFDGTTIPFNNGSFDWITVCDVLHHTDDPTAILKECGRVARRGIVIKDHLREGLLADSTLRLMDWVGNRGHGVRLPYNYLSKKEWDQTFADANLNPVQWQTRLNLYPAPFTYIFDRKLHFVSKLETG